MTLDLIVPHYKEPWETCKYLFDSIALQGGVLFDNIRVIVVNDGDCLLDETVFKDYPYKIDYVVKEHGGISDTRNYGLLKADADYVMFCDIDDGFLNNYALHTIFAAMQEGFDYCISSFIEETFDDKGNATIVKHEKDLTFMHGKVYRKEFLFDHELFFDPAMTIHEDGYFNMMVYSVAQHEGKIKVITTPLYMWRWNNNSVVRSNRKDFVLRTYEDVMLTRDGLCKQLKSRGYSEDYEITICMTVLNSYYDFQKNAFRTAANAKYYRIGEKAFKRFWDKYKSVFNNVTNEKIAQVGDVSRANARKNGFLFEREDLKTWLKHIEYEVK